MSPDRDKAPDATSTNKKMNALQKTEPQSVSVPADVSVGAMQAALAGDLSQLTGSDRLKYYGALCQFVGLNPLSRPFEWITFQGKLTLYANKGCAEQLRKIHGVSLEIVERVVQNDVLIVRTRAKDATGRTDEALGAVVFPKNPAEAALAMMRAETKSKRRCTLSICGLGMLDETEIDSVKGARHPAEAQTEGAESFAAKLNAGLTAGEKTKAVDVEVLPDQPANIPLETEGQAAGEPVAAGPVKQGTVEQRNKMFIGFQKAGFSEEQLKTFCEQKGWLSPEDLLGEWPLTHTPTTIKEMNALVTEISSFLGNH